MIRLLYLLTTVSLIFCVISAKGQTNKVTCKGSLGDPVITENFGSGGNPGPSIGAETNMNYTANPCPNDGSYTIVNNINPGQSCHNTWQVVPSDHTGNPNGYMMLINASNLPSVFFTKPLPSLCQGTTYEFSAYVLNLITLETSGPNVSEPNIIFSIETADGRVLAADTTGIIPPQPAGSLPWVKDSLLFTTPDAVSGLVLKMTNLAPGGNGNDLVLDDINFRPCGPVIQTAFNSTATSEAQNICQGASASFTLNAQVGSGIDVPAYQWQTNHGNGWSDMPGQTSTSLNISFVNAQTGTYQYRLGVASAANISSLQCRTYSTPLVINVNPLPVVSLPAKVTFCETDTLMLTATGGTTYSWSGPGFTNNTQNPLIIPNVSNANAGNYTVIATSAAGCVAAPVQTTVNIVPKVVASATGDNTICQGEITPLSASGGLYYKWTPSTGLDHDDVANPMASPDTTTTYNVTISNDGCSDDSQSVKVTVLPKTTANAGPQQTIFQGQTTILNGTAGGTNIHYYWTPADYLDNPSSLTPVASPPHDTTYTLTVISDNCGTATSNVFVRVYQKVAVPNTFSPNGDGVNDLWNIGALVTYPGCRLQVFNRYGQQVYQSTGYAKAWDGSYNGSALPVGTYYYIIDLKINTPLITGWVMIVR